MYAQRYIKNHNAISGAEQDLLAHKRVVIIGCGGLGGYLVEQLGRLGVGFMRVVDPDIFEESNLNRQLLGSMLNLGKPKVLAAKQRMQAINPLVQVETIQTSFTSQNADRLLEGFDLALDALDNIPDRLLLEETASKQGCPLVHAALSGWRGRLAVIYPGEPVLEALYGDTPEFHGEEDEQGTLAFTAGALASLQAAEAAKVLLGKSDLQGQILEVDLLNLSFDLLKVI